MTTEKFEELIEAQAEKVNLDFKQDCSWEVTRFAKHLLAFSNLKDGGNIVIGIDNNFERQGVSQTNVNTYKIDIMKDQMTRYAEPPVDFEIYKPTGKDMKAYVVIRVLPFKEIPVLCLKDDNKAGLRAATIYYRNSNRRIESAPISNASDLRDLILSSVGKMRKKLENYGINTEPNDKEELNNELGGL